MLLQVTAAVNIVALAAATWLGLYVVTRSPRSQVAWLTSQSRSARASASSAHSGRVGRTEFRPWAAWIETGGERAGPSSLSC